MHTGTHVDAPFHFLPGGEKIHTVPIENMVRPCRVLDFTHVADRITSSELEGQSIEPGDFILFKTRNSLVNGFDPNYVFLDVDGAEHLVERKIRGVGIDALSIGRGQPNPEIHRLLLKERIVIIEGLRLAEVPKGKYLLIAAPLAVVDAEAAPARVILAQMEEMPLHENNFQRVRSLGKGVLVHGQNCFYRRRKSWLHPVFSPGHTYVSAAN